MDFTTSWQGRVLVGTMRGELGIRDHEAMTRAIGEMVKSDATGVVLNFAEVVYLASVGIGMLLKLVKEVQAKGTLVVMAAPRPAVKICRRDGEGGVGAADGCDAGVVRWSVVVLVAA